MRKAEPIVAAPPPPAQYRRIERWWKPGDPKPAIDASAPAVAQAISRCLAWRAQRKGGIKVSRSLHPRQCGWCDYPDRELQTAIGYAAFVSRYDEVSGEYHNDEWARFFVGLTPATREIDPETWKKAAARRHALIEQAMYEEAEA